MDGQLHPPRQEETLPETGLSGHLPHLDHHALRKACWWIDQRQAGHLAYALGQAFGFGAAVRARREMALDGVRAFGIERLVKIFRQPCLDLVAVHVRFPSE